MSNFAAIAHVTEALRLTLEAEVGNVITGAGATTVRPDDARPTNVNIFLYHVAPSAAHRSLDAPTRDSRGALVRRPRATLDLQYLLTFHGAEANLEPQRMLGAVIRRLHAVPFLTRKTVDDAKTGKPELAKSDFESTGEAVHLTPIPLSLDDLSKLWSVFFQAKYTLSVAYQASVVTVEADEEPSSPLPVLTRNVAVFPSLGPEIDRVVSQPPIVAGSLLTLSGRNFDSPKTTLRIGGASVTPKTVNDSTITVDLTKPPLADLRAGVMTVQVVQSANFGPTGDHVIFESNLASLVLAPKITAATFTAPNVQLTVDPAVVKDQKLVLLLNQMSPAGTAYRFVATAAATGTSQTVKVDSVDPGTYLVRLQVDGAESPLDVDSNGHYSGPTVAVP